MGTRLINSNAKILELNKGGYMGIRFFYRIAVVLELSKGGNVLTLDAFTG